MAQRITETTEWRITGDQVWHLVQTRLIPLGLVTLGDDAAALPLRSQQRSVLQVSLRMKTIGPRTIDRVTRILQVLYAPPVIIPLLLAIVVAHSWMYFVHGVADSLTTTAYAPLLIPVVTAILFVSGIFHEFGHATALHYGGG